MMKKLLFGAWTLLMCVACSNEESAWSGKGESALKVELRLAASTGVNTRVDYSVATEAERTVKTLDAYLFALNEQNGGTYVLEKKYTNLLVEAWTPDDQEAKQTVSLPGVTRTAKKIFFVANGAGITSLADVDETTTETAFRALLLNTMNENPVVSAESPLVMTGEAAVEAAVWNGSPLSVTVSGVELQRVTARIDLVVNDQEQEGVAFVPTKLEIQNVYGDSFVFSSSNPYGDGSTSLTLVKEIASEGETVSGGKAYKSLLFPYETPAASNVSLSVTGALTVGDKQVVANFTIPFADADGALAVERNTCYTVTINKINGLSADASITFTVQEWEEDKKEQSVQVENFVVIGNDLSGNKLPMGGTAGNKTLTVTTNVAWKATVTMGDDFLTATASGNQLTVATISKNETGLPRTAYVVLSADADPNVSYTLVVTQAVFKNVD